jgi:hypothetical protein
MEMYLFGFALINQLRSYSSGDNRLRGSSLLCMGRTCVDVKVQIVTGRIKARHTIAGDGLV